MRSRGLEVRRVVIVEVAGSLHGRDRWCGALVEVVAEEVAADGGGAHGFDWVRSKASGQR